MNPSARSRLIEHAVASWSGDGVPAHGDALCAELERGRVLVLPRLAFALREEEQQFLQPAFCREGVKHISLRPGQEVRGAAASEAERGGLRAMLARYAESARSLVRHLLPRYEPHCVDISTSFRPAPIDRDPIGRRRDDTRLHVDAFRATPSGGRRLLRVFSNVDPEGKPRRWLIGEHFHAFAHRFAPRVRPPVPFLNRAMAALGMTRGLRLRYDHVMLEMHDLAKADDEYQRTVEREEVDFPAGSTWVAFTDAVVHAATDGQFAFEHTFMLDPAALRDPDAAPVATLETLLKRRLL